MVAACARMIAVIAAVAIATPTAAAAKGSMEKREQVARDAAAAGYEREALTIYLDLAGECEAGERRVAQLAAAARLAESVAQHDRDAGPICQVYLALGDTYDRARARREPLATVARERDRLAWRLDALGVACDPDGTPRWVHRAAPVTDDRAAQPGLARLPAPRSAADEERSNRLALTISGGVVTGIGVTLYAAMTATLIARSRAEQGAEALMSASADGPSSQVEQSQFERYESTYRTMTRASVAFGIPGTLALITGVTLIVLGKRARPRGLAVAPTLTRSYAGIGVSGRF